MNFIKERDEILKHLTSSGLRTVSPVDLKRQLEMIGFTKMCLWCGKELTGRRTSWCSDECLNAFLGRYNWNVVRYEVIKSQNYKCADCGEYSILTDFFEVHHITPIRAHNAGGNAFDRHNLVALCKECHTKRGIELNEEFNISDRLRKNKLSTLDLW